MRADKIEERTSTIELSNYRQQTKIPFVMMMEFHSAHKIQLHDEDVVDDGALRLSTMGNLIEI